MSQSDLKPCPDPRCGEMVRVFSRRESPNQFKRTYRVECVCGWESPERRTLRGAISVWNRRNDAI